MLSAITILLLFQLAGEVITQAFQLPVPGPVIGMVLLFIALVLRGGPGKELRETSGRLLQYLSMLFIPAGAGIMLHFGTLREDWLPILLAATLGTALVIAITALLLQALIRRCPPADAQNTTREPTASPAATAGPSDATATQAGSTHAGPAAAPADADAPTNGTLSGTGVPSTASSPTRPGAHTS